MAVEDWTDDGGVDENKVMRDLRLREEEWADGQHTDKYNNMHKIIDMTDSHLLNTIKYFSGLDTKPLIEEVKKRNIWK